jgi:uncharacterized paraquat-inducible protein A
MPVRNDRWSHDDDHDEQDCDEDHFDEDWVDDPDDESETVPCPSCGKDVYEDAAYCPHCDADLTETAERSPRKPWWIILGSLACMYAFYRWILMR